MSKKEYFSGGRYQLNNSNDFQIWLEGLGNSGATITSPPAEQFFKNGATILGLTVDMQGAGNGTTHFNLAIEGTLLATTEIEFLTTVTGVIESTATGGEEDVGINEGLHFRAKRLTGTAKPIFSHSCKVLRL